MTGDVAGVGLRGPEDGPSPTGNPDETDRSPLFFANLGA